MPPGIINHLTSVCDGALKYSLLLTLSVFCYWFFESGFKTQFTIMPDIGKKQNKGFHHILTALLKWASQNGTIRSKALSIIKISDCQFSILFFDKWTWKNLKPKSKYFQPQELEQFLTTCSWLTNVLDPRLELRSDSSSSVILEANAWRYPRASFSSLTLVCNYKAVT